ncbi:MAG: glucose-1-phosphate adenylyltransferase [Symbiobacteriaceae bacterium]|nr:glucose-1-phosphate adenylyltransferase [Symbiobacteriaceae bacterium]
MSNRQLTLHFDMEAEGRGVIAPLESKECVAMLLAGGRGTRLEVLTEHIAKPAVAFGGRYRLIDFTLSNCVHSGIDTVGVLTQYLPMFLHDYIGKGQPWDLDRMTGGVYLLPPFEGGDGSDWYSGSANSVYQNRRYIESYNPSYVLVLSGDHVYKMDYSKMLDYHKANDADCTIAVIDVSLEEASRFGIMTVDAKGRIVEFEEKPAKPKSTLASMGIYIFNWDLLRENLEQDNLDSNSVHDFGKNIIPRMMAGKLKMMAYHFRGYWKDVGTLESLWEANMDILKNPNLGQADWPVLTRGRNRPPHHISPLGRVRDSLVASGCRISGLVEHSIVASGVVVEEGAIVRNSVVLADTLIKRGAIVEYAILDERCIIAENAVVGQARDEGGSLTVVGGSWD